MQRLDIQEDRAEPGRRASVEAWQRAINQVKSRPDAAAVARNTEKRRWSLLLCVVGTVIVATGAFVAIWLWKRGANGDGLANSLLQDPEVPLAPSPSVLHEFKKAAVCTDGPPCSKIGRDLLKKGGSAVDAAIGAMFCNGLVNMQSMGIGGGFFMVIYDKAKKKAFSLNARETAPQKASKDMFSKVAKNGKQKASSLSKTGGLAVGVPGELKGYWEAWKKFGKLKWAELVEPTLQLCREGYVMSKTLHGDLFSRKDSILGDNHLRHIFVDNKTGEFHPPGTRIKPGKICETLEIVANEGGDVLHNGSLTKVLAEDIQAMGGLVTESDLRNYTVEWADPISVRLGEDDELYSIPPPGSGVLVGHILQVLNGYRMRKHNFSDIQGTVLNSHRIIEAYKFAFAKRTELGDPNFVDVQNLVKRLTSKDYAEEIRSKINDSSTFNSTKHYGAVYSQESDHGTAHISVLSPDGDAVSATSTVNIYFGAGFTSRRTGIILNDVMDDFAIPGVVNFFNLRPSPNNFIAPGKRPVSSSAPTIIVDREGNVKIVIGASGGTKITTAVAWVIINNIWLEEDIKKAVDHSRIHHQLVPMSVEYEFGTLKPVVDGLRKLGHGVERYRGRGSVVCAISAKNSTIFANADVRKGGEVYGF